MQPKFCKSENKKGKRPKPLAEFTFNSMIKIKDLYEKVHSILYDPTYHPLKEEDDAMKKKEKLVHMRRNKITA